LAELAAKLIFERWGVKATEVQFENGQVLAGEHSLPFVELVNAAYHAKLQLWSDGFYATPGLHWDKQTMQGHPFHYFAYGAAVSEVLVDTLSGEFKLQQVHILQDAGKSLNPAIDIGQTEGAFIQGMGWLTTEELQWHPVSGKLSTHAPSTYKIPTANDCPTQFHTRLFKRPNRQDSIHRSKAVGEPPLLLAFSVFFAIRDAISAAGGHRMNPPLQAPATPESILRAITAVQAAAAAADAASTAAPPIA
jgi:xanthine dehydrogenase large subunit